MKYISLLLIVCIAFCSCKESKQNYTNIKTSTINYVNCNIKPLDEIPLELLGEKEYVLLDNNPDCFLNFISKVITNNNYIFILDPNLYKIAVFDNKGKAITTIGKRGQGPEEYLSITDFSIDNTGNIYFIDGVLDELFIFDRNFKFKERKKLPFEADILHVLDNGNILWGLCSWNEKACKGMKTALTDEHLNIIHSAIKYDEYFDPSYMISWYKFIETEKHLIYNQPIDNNIYLFNKDGEFKEIINTGQSLVVHRPFRAPHHTASSAGLLGGGTHPQPGEVSLAHRGVLFLDEMPEFSRHTLEVMRQPLEDGHVAISRVSGSCDYPSRFMLVAAMNPCPCGYWGDSRRECRCSRTKRMEYRNRVSGPLLDRIDIQIEVTPVSYEELAELPTGEPSSVIRERVVRAREIQRIRFADDPDVFCNAEMRSRDIARYCKLDRSAQEMLRDRLSQLDLSARAYDRVLKVARTVADLEGHDAVTDSDVNRAAGWRALDRNYWM